MIDEPLTDADRHFLLGLVVDQVPDGKPPSAQVLRLMSKLSGVDTVVICRRPYLWALGPTPGPEPEPPSIAPLKFYEQEVEMTVRRTLRLMALDKETARTLVGGWLSMAAGGGCELSSVLKWSDGRQAYRPMPVETVLPEPTPVVLGEPVEIAE